MSRSPSLSKSATAAAVHPPACAAGGNAAGRESIARVAEEASRCGRPHEQIEAPVGVEVLGSQAGSRCGELGQAPAERGVIQAAVPLVHEYAHPAARRDGEIEVSVVIEVGGREVGDRELGELAQNLAVLAPRPVTLVAKVSRADSVAQ